MIWIQEILLASEYLDGSLAIIDENPLPMLGQLRVGFIAHFK
jgi:hypothetical protein